MRLVFAIVAMLAAQAVHAQVKCTVAGRTVYQQVPCEGGQRVDTSGAGKADPASPASLQLQREIAAFKRKERVEAAILEREIFVGMTRDELVRSWGNPAKINKTLSAGGASEQWIYRRGKVGYDQYVYLENGLIRSMQSSE